MCKGRIKAWNGRVKQSKQRSEQSAEIRRAIVDMKVLILDFSKTDI